MEALRAEGCEVKGMVSIFTYGFDEAAKAFAKAKVHLHSLTNYSILVDQALRDEYITEKDLLPLNEWRNIRQLGRGEGVEHDEARDRFTSFAVTRYQEERTHR